MNVRLRPGGNVTSTVRERASASPTSHLSKVTVAFGWATVPLAWVSLVSEDLGRGILFGALAMFALCIALMGVIAPGAVQASLADFRLGSWMLGFAALAYGLATLSLTKPLVGADAIVDRALAVTALTYIGLGLIIFAIGYRWGPSKMFRNATDKVTSPSRTRVITSSTFRLSMAYAIGLAATGGLVILQGGYGYIGGDSLDATSTVSPLLQPLTAISFLRTAALFGMSARWVRIRTGSALLMFVIVALSEFGIGLISGVKESVIVVALAVGIPMLLAAKRRRVPWAPVIMCLAIFVFFVTPFVTAFRGEVRSGGDRLSFGESVSVGLNSLAGESDADAASYDDSFRQVTARVRLVDSAILILDKTPSSIPYLPPMNVLLAPVTGLVPRVVWPSKPLRLSGAEFYKSYYRGQGESSSAVTMQGSLLMHGGLVTLLVGMFLFGSLIRGIDDGVFAAGPSAALLSLALFIAVVKQELEVTTVLASLPLFLVTYWVSVYAITARSPGGTKLRSGSLDTESGR